MFTFSFKTWLVLAPTLGMIVNVAIHLLVTWVVPTQRLYPRLLAAAACGGIATACISLVTAIAMELTWPLAIAYLAFNLAVFFALAFGYFNFVQLNVSSLRVRILNELYDSGAGIEVARLTAEYSAVEIVNQRLQRLVRGRQVDSRDNRYYFRFSLVYLISLSMDAAKWFIFNRRIRDSFKRERR